jgi:hypothetical protein
MWASQQMMEGSLMGTIDPQPMDEGEVVRQANRATTGCSQVYFVTEQCILCRMLDKSYG